MEPNKKVAPSKGTKTRKHRTKTGRRTNQRIHLTNIQKIVAELVAYDETKREQARKRAAADGNPGRLAPARYRAEAELSPQAPSTTNPCAVCESVEHWTSECTYQPTPPEGSDRPPGRLAPAPYRAEAELSPQAPSTPAPCAVCESVEHLTTECTVEQTPPEGSDRPAEDQSVRDHRALLLFLNKEASQLYKAHYPQHWPPLLDETEFHSSPDSLSKALTDAAAEFQTTHGFRTNNLRQQNPDCIAVILLYYSKSFGLELKAFCNRVADIIDSSPRQFYASQRK